MSQLINELAKASFKNIYYAVSFFPTSSLMIFYWTSSARATVVGEKTAVLPQYLSSLISSPSYFKKETPLTNCLSTLLFVTYWSISFR